MPRWETDAQGRLLHAALDLFSTQGYEQTTVAEIATAAGVTERTFFRHFADKREVLFSGTLLLEQPMLAVLADPSRPVDVPVVLMLDALAAAGEVFDARRDFAQRRNAIVASHPSLRERELLKLSTMVTSAADALRGRGVPEPDATLIAEIGITLFRVAFDSWVDSPDLPRFAEALDATAQRLSGYGWVSQQ